MFIVSRNRAPWVAFAFIAVVSIGAFMRFQQSAETDAKNLELDREEFQLFKKDLAPINLPEKMMNSTVLFELFRCGVRSINEAGYCNKIGEDFSASCLTNKRKPFVRFSINISVTVPSGRQYSHGLDSLFKSRHSRYR